MSFLKTYTRTWPPFLGDNDLAIIGYKKKMLEYEFGKEEIGINLDINKQQTNKQQNGTDRKSKNA